MSPLVLKTRSLEQYLWIWKLLSINFFIGMALCSSLLRSNICKKQPIIWFSIRNISEFVQLYIYPWLIMKINCLFFCVQFCLELGKVADLALPWLFREQWWSSADDVLALIWWSLLGTGGLHNPKPPSGRVVIYKPPVPEKIRWVRSIK